MNWTRRRSANYDEIVSGYFHIHRSLNMYSAYRLNPFKRFGLFATAGEAKEYCEAVK